MCVLKVFFCVQKTFNGRSNLWKSYLLNFLLALGSIILLDLVLAGDNAVVIAMASRKLPENMRKRAIYIGTAGAVVIRAIMTLIATYLLTIPFFTSNRRSYLIANSF